MMQSSFFCILLFLYIVASTFNYVFPVCGMPAVNDNQVRGPVNRRIQKRAIYLKQLEIGAKALEQLLSRTRLLYSNGYDKVLIKNGGYREAISDFNSVHPVVTERRVQKGEIVGSKGNLILTVTKDGEAPQLSIEWLKAYHNQFLDPSITFTIVYKTKKKN